MAQKAPSDTQRELDVKSGVFTQKTRRQNFDARPGTDWTIFLTLSIGHHVKGETQVSKGVMLNLTPRHQNFDARVKNSDAALPV